MNENIRENIANSRDTKLRERATRVTPVTYSGFTHPGLFQSDPMQWLATRTQPAEAVTSASPA